MTVLALPPGVRRDTVDVPGGPLAVLDAPAVPVDADRPAVVLVPGFTGSKEDFRLLLAPLAGTARRAVAVDQRGQHESPGPDDVDAYTVRRLADDLLALLDGLGSRPVHLVGHSFGGLVCRAATLARPAVVRSLTLMCSGPAALTGPRVELFPLLAPVVAHGGMPALVAAMDAVEATDPRALARPPELSAFLRARMLASSPAGLLGMAGALTSEPDLVEQLRHTGVPVLVVSGEADDAWPVAVQADMARRLNAPHIVIGDAMHSPAVENPAATLAALVQFFDDLDQRPPAHAAGPSRSARDR